MNEVKAFYNAHPYPRASQYTLPGHCIATGPLGVSGADILVVGCGTIEANLVAYHNPRSFVDGIDLSEASIAVAKSIKRHHRQRNLNLCVEDVETCSFWKKYDWVVASGVLHHIPNADAAVANIRSSMSDRGAFVGMVYSARRPEYIRRLNGELRGLSVAEAREHLRGNEWYETFVKDDAEVADTWLHPYFVEYDECGLKRLLDFPVVNVCEFGPFRDRLLFVAGFHEGVEV